MLPRITSLMLGALLLLFTCAQAGADHTLAVLPFEDNSGFDGQWDLSRGFTRLLSERLDRIKGYAVLSSDSTVSVPEREHTECSDKKKFSDTAATLGSLPAGYIIRGSVDEFGISRFGIATPGVGGYQSYRAGVQVKYSLWERGARLPLLEDESQGEIKQGGLGFTFLGKPTEEMEEYEMLDRLEFGSPDFMGTIIGVAIDSAMNDMVEKIRLALPPQGDLGADTGAVVVVSVDGGDVYINRGFEDSIRVGDQFAVYTRGDELLDPETGETLGYSDRRVGIIRVAFVKSAHLSRAEVVSEEGEIQPGNEVR